MMAQSTSVGAATTTHIIAATLDNGYHVVAVDDGEPIEDHWIAWVSELPGFMVEGARQTKPYRKRETPSTGTWKHCARMGCACRSRTRT